MQMQRVSLLISLLIVEIGLVVAYERCGAANHGQSCKPGLCCSRYGYCGDTEDQCLDGCQASFGACGMPTSQPVVQLPPTPSAQQQLPISDDGTCGPTKRCRDGHCCSKFGFCGATSGHCGDGCQDAFGTCPIKSPTPAPASTPAPAPTPAPSSTVTPCHESKSTASAPAVPTPMPTVPGTSSSSISNLPVSSDGSCGNGKRCPDGFCCSRFGFCGSSSTHCTTGCQPEFGMCTLLTSPPPSFCGAQHGNRSCSTGLCCGPNGSCGVGDAFCAAPSCQPGFGSCNLQPLPPAVARPFEPLFSPYVLVEDSFTNYATVAQRYALRWMTMAFVIANNGVPSWGYSWRADGSDPQDKVAQQIEALRKVGADAIGSFGGAAGDELATAIQNDHDLLRAYQSVISAYKFKFVDFDIEGAPMADIATNQRRNRVLAHLQRANPDVLLSFTLPVMPSGLTDVGLNLLKDADAAGVRIDAVNIMAMDYGPGNIDMGKAAIEAIRSTQSQLKALGLKSCVGVIPMIGVNDVEAEVFRQDDARELLDFTKDPTNNVCITSFWSIDRDRSSATRIPQTNFEFTQILAGAH